MIMRITQWIFDVCSQTYPFVDVHLQCAVVQREEICMRTSSCITFCILQPANKVRNSTSTEQ